MDKRGEEEEIRSKPAGKGLRNTTICTAREGKGALEANVKFNSNTEGKAEV